MTVKEYEVNGVMKSLYVDDKLSYECKAKIVDRINTKDFDWVWVVDGPEGSGKSVLAQQLAKTVDPTFDLDRMCMTPTEFTRAVLKARKGQCVVFDEAFTGLSSRSSLTEVNKLLVSLMMEMRQKNLLVIIVMPTFFLLDKYVALFRARGLFHVYLKGGKRGRWVYFNNQKKKLLYLKGKPLYSYAYPKSSFKGRFQDQYMIDEKGYRAKKEEALSQKSRVTRAETFMKQRDALIYYLYKESKMIQQEISDLITKFSCGTKLDRSTIAEAIIKLDDELKKRAVEEGIKKEAVEEIKKEMKEQGMNPDIEEEDFKEDKSEESEIEDV